MKRTASFLLAIVMAFLVPSAAYATDYDVAAEEAPAVTAAAQFSAEGIDAVSAILTEQSTGRVLFEYNADEALPPASVTKTMTMLLVMEAIDGGLIKLDDVVTVSENAASMGGSQVYLEAGEQMDVGTLLKCMTVASANDAAVALAEHISGSEATFVDKMNARAAELGCTATTFENATGLDDTTTNHAMSARDIAKISAEILKHPKILEYTTIWMDTIRNGEFGLTNTNRLIRFYDGATGLKTGSTAKAKFCISATAERNGLSLIAVVMGSSTRDARNALAKEMLDFGFANYACFKKDVSDTGKVQVKGGVSPLVGTTGNAFSAVVDKADAGKVEETVEMPEYVAAPIKSGDKIGTLTYKIGDDVVGTADIVAAQDVDKISYFTLLPKIFRWFIMAPES
ncbi:MAG: D-alanyl-D-alanine carboxypeptidase [Clostridia bacterium]|nr:D-alanyl-D-alanine carboxypeptidase [Clostridia bacterium]